MTAVRPAAERFAGARQIADAVLFEGYVHYPYRASSAKNRLRWQFGVLVPPGFGEGSGEHPDQRTEVLAEPRRGATLSAELRFLRVQRRSVQRLRADGGHEDTERLELADRVLTPWDEGVEERVELSATVEELVAGEIVVPVHCPARTEIEAVYDGGRTVGRTVRRCAQVDGVLRIVLHPLPGPYAAYRLRAVVENTTEWTPGPESGIWEIPVAWELDDFPHFFLKPPYFVPARSVDDVGAQWRAEFDYAHAHVPGGVFTLTMHPQVIGRGPRMAMLDDLVAHMRAAGDVSFSTLGGVAAGLNQPSTRP